MAALEGMGVGAVMTAGLLVLHGTVAATLGVVAGTPGPGLPAAGVGLGLLLAAWGAAILVQPQRFWVSLPVPHLKDPLRLRGWGGAALYGVVFGLASLGCTFPLFAVLLFQDAASGSAGGGGVVLTYAAGMGAVLMGLAVAARLARSAVERWLRWAGAVAARLAGAMLLLSGAFVAACWLGFGG